MGKGYTFKAYVVLVVAESGGMRIRIFSSPPWGLTRTGNWPMYALLMPESEGDSFEQAARKAEEQAEQWMGRAQGHLFAWRAPKEPPQHVVAEPVEPHEAMHHEIRKGYLRRVRDALASAEPYVRDAFEQFVDDVEKDAARVKRGERLPRSAVRLRCSGCYQSIELDEHGRAVHACPMSEKP